MRKGRNTRWMVVARVNELECSAKAQELIREGWPCYGTDRLEEYIATLEIDNERLREIEEVAKEVAWHVVASPYGTAYVGNGASLVRLRKALERKDG